MLNMESWDKKSQIDSENCIGSCVGSTFLQLCDLDISELPSVLLAEFYLTKGAILSCTGTDKPRGLHWIQRRIGAQSGWARAKEKLFPLPLGKAPWPLWVSLHQLLRWPSQRRVEWLEAAPNYLGTGDGIHHNCWIPALPPAPHLPAPRAAHHLLSPALECLPPASSLTTPESCVGQAQLMQDSEPLSARRLMPASTGRHASACRPSQLTRRRKRALWHVCDPPWAGTRDLRRPNLWSVLRCTAPIQRWLAISNLLKHKLLIEEISQWTNTWLYTVFAKS